MNGLKIAVIGAGAGGLSAALQLAVHGHQVTVFEKEAAPGGKIRQLPAGQARVDAGPTVFTMKWVFDQIFAEAGETFSDHVRLSPLDCLARHAWSASERLDLYADAEKSAEAIAAFAGAREAQGFRDFCARARAVYGTLEKPFIRSTQPTPLSLALRGGIGDMWRISPFTTLWQALGEHFHDERLRQLFGRYATYCGSSPYSCPATLMLVAHVEQAGVWTIDGGMHELVKALVRVAEKNGAHIRYRSPVVKIEAPSRAVTGIHLASGEFVPCDAVVVNADANAVASGLLGPEVTRAAGTVAEPARSLSAITWTLEAEARGFPLMHHNVFFSNDYAREFREIFEAGRVPAEPTVYVCAQDRDDGARPGADGAADRLLVLINAPANGDRYSYSIAEVEQCRVRAQSVMERCGLILNPVPDTETATSPAQFERLFPGTGGALYGQASHGWAVSFSRPEARTKVPGLYLAGGSVHPGPGVPMAAISGWLAAASLMADLNSRTKWMPVAIPGGMSMP